jgi:protein-L-isoaspartate(D-aspartate) O-methyltransferase
MVSFRVIGGLASSLFLGVAAVHVCASRADESEFSAQRAAMVSEVELYARLAGDTMGQAIDERVLRSLGEVPRHEFVPDAQARYAYENRPLPIGYGQTISQPYIVALMTNLIGPDEDDVVLEVGTGSGYQAAILAGIVKSVYSVEIVPPLAIQAKSRLERLGYDNVTTRVADGYYGWQEHAPFDAIVVTAAASHVPPPLLEQLRPGGYMVIPVGGRFMTQQLLLIQKTLEGEVRSWQIASVRFVPLTGER